MMAQDFSSLHSHSALNMFHNFTVNQSYTVHYALRRWKVITVGLPDVASLT